jgi:hypothetical protein
MNRGTGFQPVDFRLQQQICVTSRFEATSNENQRQDAAATNANQEPLPLPPLIAKS